MLYRYEILLICLCIHVEIYLTKMPNEKKKSKYKLLLDQLLSKVFLHVSKV